MSSLLSVDLYSSGERADDLLAQRIRARILARNRSSDRQLTIQVNSRVATLSGRAETFHQRQQWLHDVKSFAELAEIIDLIEVA